MDGQALFLKVEKFVNARKEEFPLTPETKEAWDEFGELVENLGSTIRSQADAVQDPPTPAAEDEVQTPEDAGIEDPGFGQEAMLGADTVPVAIGDSDDAESEGDDD